MKTKFVTPDLVVKEDCYNFIIDDNLQFLFGHPAGFSNTHRIDFTVKEQKITTFVEVCASVSDTKVREHLDK